MKPVRCTYLSRPIHVKIERVEISTTNIKAMHEQAFSTLEYTQLRALVRRGAQTMMGRSRVEQLVPLSDPLELRRALRGVSECVELRRRQGG
ncbi:MAG TPA: hypothetical protein VGC64_10585, partial [Pyrinomonadaceae bacterium]